MDAKIKNYIKQNKARLFQLLEELVLIQSFSRNKKGVDQVGLRIAQEFDGTGFNCAFINNDTLGNNLVVRSPCTAQNKNQILVTGHMDTVFPPDSAFNWYKESKSRCFGPGVADMKGGLVVGIFAIKALIHAQRMRDIPLTFIFNSDEEIGSPDSRDLIAEEAARSRLAYVLEAGGLSNDIVTGRKGSLRMQLSITGKAGHAAFAGTDKASAIHELAHKICAIEAMNVPEQGMSANVGVIRGGIGANTVPDQAFAELDFRFLSPDQSSLIRSRMDELTKQSIIPGTTTMAATLSGRPPMPQTQAGQELFERIQSLSHELGTPVVQELRQGVSDANIIASVGTPVIDGLGPVGAKDHSEDEYIEKASLWERCILFAHILAEI